MVVRIFSRTKVHTKRFLSRSVSPHKVFSHTKRLFTRSVSSNAEFHHSAVGPVAHSDELLYPARATTPQEIDQFRPRRHPATAPRAQLLTLTSPSLCFKQTSSSLLFLLTSSPLNMNGRALIDHNDEPFTVPQTDGLLRTILIDELSLQHKQTSSFCS